MSVVLHPQSFFSAASTASNAAYNLPTKLKSYGKGIHAKLLPQNRATASITLHKLVERSDSNPRSKEFSKLLKNSFFHLFDQGIKKKNLDPFLKTIIEIFLHGSKDEYNNLKIVLENFESLITNKEKALRLFQVLMIRDSLLRETALKNLATHSQNKAIGKAEEVIDISTRLNGLKRRFSFDFKDLLIIDPMLSNFDPEDTHRRLDIFEACYSLLKAGLMPRSIRDDINVDARPIRKDDELSIVSILFRDALSSNRTFDLEKEDGEYHLKDIAEFIAFIFDYVVLPQIAPELDFNKENYSTIYVQKYLEYAPKILYGTIKNIPHDKLRAINEIISDMKKSSELASNCFHDLARSGSAKFDSEVNRTLHIKTYLDKESGAEVSQVKSLDDLDLGFISKTKRQDFLRYFSAHPNYMALKVSFGDNTVAVFKVIIGDHKNIPKKITTQNQAKKARIITRKKNKKAKSNPSSNKFPYAVIPTSLGPNETKWPYLKIDKSYWHDGFINASLLRSIQERFLQRARRAEEISLDPEIRKGYTKAEWRERNDSLISLENISSIDPNQEQDFERVREAVELQLTDHLGGQSPYEVFAV